MQLRALDGAIGGPFTALPELPPPTPDVVEQERAEARRELDTLVDRRREAGAPLPPGDCAPPPPAVVDASTLDM
jgi:hypothetical protein